METNWIRIAVEVVTGGSSLALGIWHSRRQARGRRRSQIWQRLQEACKSVHMTERYGNDSPGNGPLHY
jgi:hypothetical protein